MARFVTGQKYEISCIVKLQLSSLKFDQKIAFGRFILDHYPSNKNPRLRPKEPVILKLESPSDRSRKKYNGLRSMSLTDLNPTTSLRLKPTNR